MPQLVWNETDFIECLGVLPEIDEYETGRHFTIHRNGLRLLLSVYQYDAAVWLSLYREESKEALFTIQMSDCSGTRYVKGNKERSYLEFAAANLFSNRYDGESLIPMGVRLSVDPDFKIELFQV
ncbi:MAG TPA: hypothetical protein PLD20_03340 [Blastocatellia bacterium]|nr:hypothetical protein [Blastocatellia bacterium]HMV82035.1 hypothetical protein [Blastocatellia bacterium]HMX24037.1 hypothetical protein [Blastocatellia bacterium]HMY72772.1 hypothetical protein [Blastocatellia bacterium]HMZ16936.1 hypothetical protein [Blastocatellia bacterium]